MKLSLVSDLGNFVGDLFDGINDIKLLDGVDTVFNGLGDIDVIDAIDDLEGREVFRGTTVGDVVIGLVTNDILIGLIGNDVLLGLLGDDLLNGGKGDDILRGASGSDTLIGQLGTDLLEGGTGNDVLIGGKGLDKLIGGPGRDTFALELKNGADLVKDFKDRSDRLGLPKDVGFSDLSIKQISNKTVVSYGSSRLAVLDNVQVNQISKADFTEITQGLF